MFSECWLAWFCTSLASMVFTALVCFCGFWLLALVARVVLLASYAGWACGVLNLYQHEHALSYLSLPIC